MTDCNDPHKRFYITMWNDTLLFPSLLILVAGFCCVQCSDKVQIDVDFNSWEAQVIQASDRDFPGDPGSTLHLNRCHSANSPKRVNDYERGYLLGKHTSCNFVAYLSFNMPPAIINLPRKETLSNESRWLVFNLSIFQINFNISLVQNPYLRSLL